MAISASLPLTMSGRDDRTSIWAAGAAQALAVAPTARPMTRAAAHSVAFILALRFLGLDDAESLRRLRPIRGAGSGSGVVARRITGWRDRGATGSWRHDEMIK